MGISESILKMWTNQGDQAGSAGTYASIKSALAAHNWPTEMRHEVYLQGSYPNSTNIRRDSDVDVVVESPSILYHNVPQHQRVEYGLSRPAQYTWQQFRDQVYQALRSYYGSAVTSGKKCIKVAGNSSRLSADVVPCCTYHQYRSVYDYGKGITFWISSGTQTTQIVNFPKLHKRHGEAKNPTCHGRYKPAIRMFKNARNTARSEFPSYFLECLLYNVPDSRFHSVLGSTYVGTLDFLDAADVSSFMCQNRQQKIIGHAPWQISLPEVREVLRVLRYLWDA